MSADLSIIASELERGQTIRTMCPRCGGGTSGEQSLSVTMSEDGAVLWHCFRAKCGYAGASRSGEYATRPEYKRKETKPEFTGPTEPIGEKEAARIKELWGITDPPYWYWAPTVGRLAMSIRSPKYTHRGWVLRDIWGRSDKKAITYLDEGEEGISWYREKLNAHTVVVEDIPSAMRASTHVNSVALCGTAIGPARAIEIATYATRPVILALDQDATAISFRYAEKYSLLWGDVIVLPLKKDIKNMTEEEVRGLLT